MTNGVSSVSSNSCPHGESLIGTNYMGRNYTCFEKVFCSGWKANGWIWAARVISILVLPIFVGIAGAHLLSQACSNKNDGGDGLPSGLPIGQDNCLGRETRPFNRGGSDGIPQPSSPPNNRTPAVFTPQPKSPAVRVEEAREKLLAEKQWRYLGLVGQGGVGMVRKYHDHERQKMIIVKCLKAKSVFLDAGRGNRVKQQGVRLERGEALALELPEHNCLLKTTHLIVYDQATATCQLREREQNYGSSDEFVVGTITEEIAGAKDLEARQQEKLNKEGKPAIIDLSSFTKKIASAIHAMHQKNFAHRDIKPANILMHGEDEYKLIDFGFTRNLERSDDDRDKGKTYTQCGTNVYLAPEVFFNASDGYDPKKADAWSFGITLFYLAFRQLPLHCTVITKSNQGLTPYALMKQVLETIQPGNRGVLSANRTTIEQKCPENPYAQNQQFWDLLGKLICHADKRLTFAEIGQHPFCSRTANAEET